MATPTPGPRRRGVALGVLGLMLLVFFSMVFMLGRHSYWHKIYDEVVHPFDPHPEGIVRHGKIPVVSTGKDPASKPAETAQKSDPPKEASKPPPKAASKPPPRQERPKDGEEGLTQLDKDYKPTREMVQKIAQDGYLVVTWANWHYQDFVNTWVKHVQGVGITGYIVGAMDDHLLQWLIDGKLNCFSMKSGLTLGDFGWGSATFAKMGREKIKLIRVFLQLGVDVIISDVDVLWLRNPIPYFKQYPDADILTSSDHLENTVPGYELERWPHAASAANIGIMLFRNKSMDFVNQWIHIIEKDATVWDQNAFNDLFRRGVKDLPNNEQHLFLGYDGTLKMGILPVSVFCSGHTFFTQRMFKKLKLEPYALHATFQFSGTPGKRHRMREFMLFEDPPEYYDHKNGFISFAFDGLPELLKDAGPNTGKMELANVQGHFKLVNHQIARVRSALAIATLTGRAIIVPQLWCGQDRWWAPHSGRIPGSSFDLPFPCPMDHVYDLEGGWARQLPTDAYGPNIDFREYSFLENRRTPASVKSSKLTIEVCPPKTAGCADGTAPAAITGDKLQLQAGLDSDKIKTALSGTTKYKVLHFETMSGVFTNFTAEADWTKFFNRVRIYGSIWCCVAAHPGHIHYDPWFDIPHIDKFNHQVDKWEPKCGP